MKILIYIIIIILVLRFIRSLVNTHVIIHKFARRPYNESTTGKNREREGKITIIEPAGEKNPQQHTGSKGDPADYVDYEEIK